MKTPKRPGILAGVLATLAAGRAGLATLIKSFSVGVRSRTDRPAWLQSWLIAQARAKRLRRAHNPCASAYARSNIR